MEQPSQNPETFVKFLNAMFDGLDGYVYLARKVPEDAFDFEQKFFLWPSEKPQIIDFVTSRTKSFEVYIAPALYRTKSALKENVKYTQYIWCEFDGNVPSDLKGIPEPTIRVQSSSKMHQHWYWRLDEVLDQTDEIETLTRSLAYTFTADASGWDATQVLRPPNTNNHKRGLPVILLDINDNVYSVSDFEASEAPPPVEEIPIPDSIPDVTEVVSKYKYTTKVWELFKKGRPQGERSDGLMQLGYSLAEMQLENYEIFSMLLNADERWGKFKGRQDQYRRLMEIVVRAREKYPYTGSSDLTPYDDPQTPLEGMGFRTLLSTERQLEWVWDGYLHRRGTLLLTGPSGVGKSQMALSACQHFVLGKPFLGRAVQNVGKIGFFSLEMALEEMKEIVKVQAMQWTSEELDVLEENLISFPLGETIYLNRDQEKSRVEKLIEEHQFDGIVFDSLGSTSDSELTNEGEVKNVLDWIERIKNKYDCFVWFIHHHRKASGDNKKPNKLADVYGSQYITARASSVFTLWDQSSKTPDILQAICLKMRSAKKPFPTLIHRTNKLHFTESASMVDKKGAAKVIATPEALKTKKEEPPSISKNLTGNL